MSATWPRVTRSVSTLTEHDANTTLRLEWTAFQASQVQLGTCAGVGDSMRIGWRGTFEQLEQYLGDATKPA